MTTISDKIKSCNFVINNLLNEQERIIYAHEKDIINLNIQNIEEGQGSNNAVLKNTNPIFDGSYSLSTNLLNPNKKAGALYNFFETGAFLGNFQVDVRPNAVQFDIFSTGTGSGDKSLFFAGYTNLFGLDNEDSERVNKIIYEDLMLWVNKHI